MRKKKDGWTICKKPGSRIWQMWKWNENGGKHRVSTGISMSDHSKEEAQAWIDAGIREGVGDTSGVSGAREDSNGSDAESDGVEDIVSGRAGSGGILTIGKFTRQIELRLTKKGLASGTIVHYLSALKHLGKVYGINFDVRAIKRDAVWKMQEYLMTQPGQTKESKMKNCTINIVLRYLSGAFGVLVNDEIIARNPFSRFEVLYEESKDYSLSDEELVSLFAAMREEATHPEYTRIARILLYTGARVSEILKSERDDIDSENWEWTLMNIKTRDHRTREIAITGQIKEDIRYFLDKYPDKKHPFGITSRDGMSRFVRRWLNKAGIKGKKLHSFRHTYATRAVNDGNNNIRDVQAALGHSSVTTTERYLHERKTPKLIDIAIDI